jgi:hypothetical protein
MKPILYTNGDSVVWGAELESKETQRFSSLISKEDFSFDNPRIFLILIQVILLGLMLEDGLIIVIKNLFK